MMNLGEMKVVGDELTYAHPDSGVCIRQTAPHGNSG
jgi:hypothetical protein